MLERSLRTEDGRDRPSHLLLSTFYLLGRTQRGNVWVPPTHRIIILYPIQLIFFYYQANLNAVELGLA